MAYRCKNCGNGEEFFKNIITFDSFRIRVIQDERFGDEELWDPVPGTYYTLKNVECAKCKSQDVVEISGGMEHGTKDVGVYVLENVSDEIENRK